MLVSWRSRISVWTRPTSPDLTVLDGVPEGPLNDPFPQATDGPLLGDYEYESDADLYHGTPQNAPPTPASASEQDQVSEGRGPP